MYALRGWERLVKEPFKWFQTNVDNGTVPWSKGITTVLSKLNWNCNKETAMEINPLEICSSSKFLSRSNQHPCTDGQNPNTDAYIIMPYIPNSGSLSKALIDPFIKEVDPHILNLFIHSLRKALKSLHSNGPASFWALSAPFLRIRSLLLHPATKSYTVATRPLSVNMNQVFAYQIFPLLSFHLEKRLISLPMNGMLK